MTSEDYGRTPPMVSDAVASWFDDVFRIYGEVIDSQRRLAVALVKASAPVLDVGEKAGEKVADGAERLSATVQARRSGGASAAAPVAGRPEPVDPAEAVVPVVVADLGDRSGVERSGAEVEDAETDREWVDAPVDVAGLEDAGVGDVGDVGDAGDVVLEVDAGIEVAGPAATGDGDTSGSTAETGADTGEVIAALDIGPDVPADAGDAGDAGDSGDSGDSGTEAEAEAEAVATVDAASAEDTDRRERRRASGTRKSSGSSGTSRPARRTSGTKGTSGRSGSSSTGTSR